MLVMTRTVGQTIDIGNIAITVTEIRGGKVRIGVEAPDATQVLRREAKNREPKSKDVTT